MREVAGFKGQHISKRDFGIFMGKGQWRRSTRTAIGSTQGKIVHPTPVQDRLRGKLEERKIIQGEHTYLLVIRHATEESCEQAHASTPDRQG